MQPQSYEAVQFPEIPRLPAPDMLTRRSLFVVQPDPENPAVYLATGEEVDQGIAPGMTVKPRPDAPTFTDFTDTNAGGSVRLIPAQDVPMAEYVYKFGPQGLVAPVPPDGIISVGNQEGRVYAYSLETTARQQSLPGASAAFTVYTAPNELKTTPDPPTFTNFQDNNAGGSVTLVRAFGVPMSDYLYKIGSGGTYGAVPQDGVINVGNIDGQVFAYSLETSTRNASRPAASAMFTSYTAPAQGLPTPLPPKFTNFQDTPAGGSVQLVPADGLAFADYVVKLGVAGTYAPAPADGLIDAGDLAGQVYAYSPAVTGVRNQSATAASNVFSAAVVNSTPEMPGVVADDTADTLAFTSPLGTGEIVVSTNGGAYAAYAGPYAVGNVARDEGYYKAKVKAATGRNESAVRLSPAFGVAGGAPSFAQHLQPGDNVATLAWNANAGVTLDYDNPVQATATAPGADGMNVFFPDMQTQVGLLNFDHADLGKPCGVTIAGQLYYKISGGAALTFTNGDVLLSL